MPSEPKQERRQVPWFLLLVLLGSTTINYIDRISISVLAPTLRDEFGMSNTDYAWAVNAFQFGYMIFYIIGGRLADRWGVRLALTVYVLWWSGAGMLHALTTGALTLALFRFLLAMGEGGTWPTVLKAVAENVPGPIRSFSMGIVNSGSSVGALLAPPVVGYLALQWGWRAAFLITGGLGLVLAPLWLFAHRRVERQAPPPETKAEHAPWLSLLRYKQTWAMFLCRGFGEPTHLASTSFTPSTSNTARMGPPAMIPVPAGAARIMTLPAPQRPGMSWCRVPRSRNSS